jgi:hypothetical protein
MFTGQVYSVDAEKLRILRQRDDSLRSIEKMLVYIKRGNDEVCSGVQVSDAWILSLADCIEEK